MIEFFAEISSNYITKDGPSYDRALELIETAKEIGCTGVKFQYFKANKLWHPSMKKELEIAKVRELPLKWIGPLSNFAKKEGLLFGLSVFDKDGVDEIKEYVDYFKIASFEIGLFDLIEKCYLTEKRLMLSMGQSDRNEIIRIITDLPEISKEQRIDVLYCISKYPALPEDCNLNIIKYNHFINGYSDHTVNYLILYTAISLGAKVIEFHLDLIDKLGLETEHSWQPHIMELAINYIKIIEQALGTDNWDEIIKQQDRTYRANSETGLRGG